MYPADGVDVSSVKYLEEARRLLDAIDRGEGKALKFNDSRKKKLNVMRITKWQRETHQEKTTTKINN